MPASTYRRLLAVPGAPAFVVPGFVARLPMSMLGLGVVVLVSAITGSYGLAGAVSATLTCAGAIGAPVLGTLIDRRGQHRVLLPALVVHCAALAALVSLAVGHAPTWTLFVAAVATGCAVPPVSSMVRARWTHLLGGGTVDAEQAYAFESVVDELVFMAGPVLVTTLATAIVSWAGLVCSGGLAVVGGVVFALQRRTEPPPAPRRTAGARVDAAERAHRSAMSLGGVRVLAAACVLVGVVFGTIDVAMVAFAGAHGAKALSGVLLAMVAAGSGSSGLWYGSRSWKASLHKRFLIGCGFLTLSMSSLAWAPNIAVMAVLAFVAGFAISPTLIAGFGLVERLVPPHMLTEGFTWVSTALALGVGAGTTVAGRLVDAIGPSQALIVCPCAALAAGLLAMLGRRRLAGPYLGQARAAA